MDATGSVGAGAAMGAKVQATRPHDATRARMTERGFIYAPTAKTRQAAVMTTATSEAGRKTFQPRRISWS